MGRAVTTSLLSDIGGLLLDIHGQGEHLLLLHEQEHGGLLDRYAGLESERAALAALVRRVRQVQHDWKACARTSTSRARRIDLLSYQVEEIRSARLKPGEQEELEIERRRLGECRATGIAQR